jgi:hypothetical protein
MASAEARVAWSATTATAAITTASLCRSPLIALARLPLGAWGLPPMDTVTADILLALVGMPPAVLAAVVAAVDTVPLWHPTRSPEAAPPRNAVPPGGSPLPTPVMAPPGLPPSLRCLSRTPLVTLTMVPQ